VIGFLVAERVGYRAPFFLGRLRAVKLCFWLLAWALHDRRGRSPRRAAVLLLDNRIGMDENGTQTWTL
jgi:hypothetical protein